MLTTFNDLTKKPIKATVTFIDGSVEQYNKYLFNYIVSDQKMIELHTLAVNTYYKDLDISIYVGSYAVFQTVHGRKVLIDPRSIADVKYHYGEVL